MARLRSTKKKKSPRATELSQLKENCSASPSNSNLANESSNHPTRNSARLWSSRPQRARSSTRQNLEARNTKSETILNDQKTQISKQTGLR